MKLNNLFLTIVFVISVAVLFFVAGISFKHVSQLNKSQKLEAHTYEVKLELEKFFSAMKSAETNNRGYVITKDSTFLQSVENSKKELFQNIKAIKNLTATLPIPPATQFLAKSTPSATLASTDGVNFAAMPLKRKVGNQIVNVPLQDYRALRWTIAEVPAGKSVSVSAQTRVNSVTP